MNEQPKITLKLEVTAEQADAVLRLLDPESPYPPIEEISEIRVLIEKQNAKS